MQILFLLILFLCLFCSASSQDDLADHWREYVALLETFDKYGYGDRSMEDELNRNSSSITVEAHFDCKPSASLEKPTSVHKLRPGDINVIAAMGDSLTAANGAGADTVLGVAIQYRGLAASIGGDESLEQVITLPNIMRNYNADIYGYSTGTGTKNSRNSKLNVAVPGAVTDGMPKQARKLVDKMKNDPNVDFENDWKMVTIFIGGNDLCRYCKYPERYSPENYIIFFEETLMILTEIPRMFVNVIGMLNVQNVAELSSFSCDILHQFLCPCGMKEDDRELLRDKTRQYQSLLQSSIDSGKFDIRDDFTAVFQPFYIETTLPRHADGSPDYSFFAPDCFHLSAKGQGAQAISTWNNMIQPVGYKDRSWTPGEDIRCPSEDFPFLYTNKNSRDSWSGQDSDENQHEGTDQQPPQQEQQHQEQQHQEEAQKQDNFGSPVEPPQEGGLSGGSIAVIAILALVVVGAAMMLVVRRVKQSRNPYIQL
ncbi:phospholipase B1, membrane-associated-like isoform X1 [Asterias amurensis]|uniref:phospholipase B1, membrane-associated-like isoform X1 n=1 Tax=Asterias amurensis TaxID=7602 RepID=UPI003AB8E4DB